MSGRKNHRPLILVLNPGSTSTRTALFRGKACLFTTKTAHPLHLLRSCRTIPAQVGFRVRSVSAALKKHGFSINDSDAVVARGGLLQPCACGVYRINSAMLDDLRASRFGEHASNLGAMIADHVALKKGIPAFVVDPPVVDELCKDARLSGMPGISRRAVWHALNQKMAARLIARRLNIPYEKINLIVAHMGGGTSIAAHRRGRAIDVTNALDGEGTFAVERSGAIAAADILRMVQTFSPDTVLERIAGNGGISGYLKTNDFLAAEKRSCRGDSQAAAVISAMAYQTAKDIAGCAAVLCGHVDAIVLTGSVASSKRFVGKIKRRIRFIAPVYILPGEMEMQALAEGAMSVLAGSAKARTYPPVRQRDRRCCV